MPPTNGYTTTGNGNGASPQPNGAPSPRRPVRPRPADPSKEYVSGGGASAFATYAASLPPWIDDVSRDLGEDLYERMLLDAQVYKCVRNLKLAAVADGLTPRPVVDDKDHPDFDLATELADFCTRCLERLELLTRRGIEEWLLEMLDAVALGNKVAEQTMSTEEGGADAGKEMPALLKCKPRRSYAFVVDRFWNVIGLLGLIPGQASMLSVQVTDPRQLPSNLLPREKFAVLSWDARSGDPRGHSVLRPAYAPWWNKLQSISQLLKYQAIYAVPPLFGTTPDQAEPDPSDDSLGNAGAGTGKTPEQSYRDSLLALQAGGVVVAPFGHTLVPLQVGNQAPFLAAIDLWDRQIAGAVLGAVLATEEASYDTLGASQTHQDVMAAGVRALKRAAGRMVRTDLFFRWVELNYGTPVALRLTPYASLSPVEHQDWPVRANAVASLHKTGYLAPEQYADTDEQLGLPPRDHPPEPPQPAPAPGGKGPDGQAPPVGKDGKPAAGGQQGDGTAGFADTSGGVWRTINGVHVLIKDGKIVEGPAHLKGKAAGVEHSLVPEPPEHGVVAYNLHVGDKQQGGVSLTVPEASGKVAEAARQSFPSLVSSGQTVSAVEGAFLPGELRGKSLGQTVYLDAMAQHGADWYYGKAMTADATNVYKALSSKGLVEVHWGDGKEPGWGDRGGVHLARLTEAGKRAASSHAPDSLTGDQWQRSFLPGDPGGSAPAVQGSFFETGKSPKRRRDLPGQQVMFAADAGCQWVTLGADHSAPPGEKGGTPVCIKGGVIEKGHPSLTGKRIDALKESPDKGPHALTRVEWDKHLESTGQRDEYGPGPHGIRVAHREEVAHALKSGKPVPEAVLKDYPDLAKKYPNRVKASPEAEQPSHRKQLAQSKEYDRAVWAKKARKEGMDPKDLHSLAAQMLAHDAAFKQDHADVLKDAERSYGHGSLKTLAARHGKGKMDADSVRGLDDLASELQEKYPHILGTDKTNAQYKLYDMLTQPRHPPMGEHQAYAEAFDHLKSEHERHKAEDERFKLKPGETVPFADPPPPCGCEPAAETADFQDPSTPTWVFIHGHALQLHNGTVKEGPDWARGKTPREAVLHAHRQELARRLHAYRETHAGRAKQPSKRRTRKDLGMTRGQLEWAEQFLGQNVRTANVPL